MSLLAMKAIEREVQRRFLQEAVASPMQAEAKMKSVLSNAMKQVGVSDMAELHGKLRSRTFRKQFFSALGAEYRKQFGFSASISDEKIGVAVFKLNQRIAVARARVGQIARIGPISTEQAIKLSALFDETASKFGMNSVEFLSKYASDTGFRVQVNEYLSTRMRELAATDKGFEALANEKPETIMAVMAGTKAAFLSTSDKAKFMLSQLKNVKLLGTEFVKTFASVAVTTLHQMGLAGTMPILAQIPGMGSASFILYYSGQHVAQTFGTVYNALRRGQSEDTLRLFGDAVALRETLKQTQSGA